MIILVLVLLFVQFMCMALFEFLLSHEPQALDKYPEIVAVIVLLIEWIADYYIISFFNSLVWL